MRITLDSRALEVIEVLLSYAAAETGQRVDAGEVGFVAKDLEYTLAQNYDVEYPELMATQLIPVNTEVDPGAEVYSYEAWDLVGKAIFISDYANDFPNVEAFMKRYFFPTAGIGVSYQYTYQDLRKSAMRRLSKGPGLDQQRAKAAALAHAQFQDKVACYGDTKRGLSGFINHPDIPTATIPNGSWDTFTTGSDTENGKIVNDLNALCLTPEVSTFGLYKADTLLLPLSQKKRLMQPTSTLVRQPLILNWLANQQDIKNVVFWYRLDTNGSDGNLSANVAQAMVYKRTPEVLFYVIPLPFTQHAPIQKGLAFQIPCESRTGGVCVIRPIACAKVNVHS